jgi:hypothetical protein
LQDILYDGGNYTFQSGTRSWPFRFTIPIEAESEDPRSQRPQGKRELDRIGILKKNDIEGLENDHFSSSPTWRGSYDHFRGRPDPHRLPDTFEYVSNRFPASCEARVEYELTATLKRPTRGVLFPAKDLEAALEVVLRSRNHPDCLRGAARTFPYATQVVEIKQMYAGGSKTSLLDRAATSIFKSSDPRGVNVTIVVVLNRFLRPGGRCSLLLRATQEMQVSPIKLRSYTLRLIARTALRAKLDAVMVQDVNHHAVDGRVLLSGKGSDRTVPQSKAEEHIPAPVATETSLKDWLDLSSDVPADQPDRFVTPTFKTYNINREYALTLEIKLDCGGSKHDVKRENIDVTILAAEDYTESLKTEDARGVPAVTEQVEISQTDSRATPQTTDEKKGPFQPPSREPEEEQLPQYEPGDVPVYHAGEDPIRRS